MQQRISLCSLLDALDHSVRMGWPGSAGLYITLNQFMASGRTVGETISFYLSFFTILINLLVALATTFASVGSSEDRTGTYPYPFLDVRTIGYGRTLVNVMVLTTIFLVTELAIVAISRKRGQTKTS